MRWETLFADLESQLEAQRAEELREEIAESVRVERARQYLNDRLAGYRGQVLTIRVGGSQEITGALGPVGEDYLCVEDPTSRWLVRRAALQAVVLPHQRAEVGRLARTKFPSVVRALVRDRQPLAVYGLQGNALGEGTLEQAAADFLVLGIHPRDEFARTRTVQARLLIPYETVAWISIKSLE